MKPVMRPVGAFALESKHKLKHRSLQQLAAAAFWEALRYLLPCNKSRAHH